MSEPQTYADRVYRSGAAMVAGALLLGLGAWLAGDAILRGEGRTPLTAVAALLLAAPVVVAFTFRPAVFASDARLRVRNPFRTITVPWARVDTIRAQYSTELLADGRKFQLWAIPVSLRARSRVNRHNARLSSGEPPRTGPFSFGLGGARSLADAPEEGGPRTAPGDAAVAELRELAESHAADKAAQGPVVVRWCYEILAPAAVGGLALLALLLAG